MVVDTKSASQVLAQRLTDRSANICVIGLGYVGLPTAVAFAQAGFAVTGVDANADRCSMLNARQSYIEDVPSRELSAVVRSGHLHARQTLPASEKIDVFDICVPTPLDKSREPDISAIRAVLEALAPLVRPGQLLILTSTTYPGTTVELLQPLVEDAGLKPGVDAFIAFAPERIDPGNNTYSVRNTPRVLGGITAECTEMATQLFSSIVDRIVPVSSPTAAEMTKLLENTFRSVNIALANEVAIMCRRLNVDVWEVIGAAASKPYGFMPFYPGPGLGGHCIPVDPHYLSWKLRSLDYVARFIDLAESINHQMPEYVVSRAADILNQRSRSVKGARILVLGVAYKRGIGDLRESPALDVILQLHRRGADVAFSDPHVVDSIEVDDISLEPMPCDEAIVRNQDLVIVTTDHAEFDWEAVHRWAVDVLDTRGVAVRLGLTGWHTL